MKKIYSRQKRDSSLKNDGNFRKILAECLSSHMNIQNTNCQITWKDVDKFNVETKNNRDPGKIKIDSKNFIIAIKQTAENRMKELQLIALGKHVISTNPSNVIGSDRYLMLQTIQDNGHQNYINNKVIQEAVNSPNTKMSPQMRQKLLNIGNNIKSLGTMYLLVNTCYIKADTGCLQSIAGVGYSIASSPVQNSLLKKMPEFMDNLAIISSKELPKFLGHNTNTKFVIQTVGKNHIPKMVKMSTAAVGPIFDVISMAVAINNLVECDVSEKNGSPCVSMAIRDNIAVIALSGASLGASGILIAKGALAGPWGIAVGVSLTLITGVYYSISLTIYYAKYNLTKYEYVDIFMRRMFFIDTGDDIIHLSHQSESTNKQTEIVSSNFNELPNNIVAYAVGVGKAYTHQMYVHKEIPESLVPWKKNTQDSIVIVRNTKYHAGYSEIDLSSGIEKYDNKLSRILPKPIEGITFSCLPALTNEPYEKEGTSNSLSSYPDVKHYCNNAIVMEYNARMQNSSITAKSVLFDLKYINSGKITGSNTLNNIFLLGNPIGNPSSRHCSVTIVSGTSVENHFYSTRSACHTKLLFSNNSVNTIHLEPSQDYPYISKFMCTTGSIIINPKLSQRGDLGIYSQAVDSKDKFSIHYIGIKQKSDDVHCNYEVYDAKNNSDKCEYIDTGGGTIDGIDLIMGCKKVIIRPYTIYSSKTNSTADETSDIRDFKIVTDGYESDKNSFASISLNSIDTASIVLSNISVLLDTKEVTYISQNQTLIMKFLLSKEGIFTLYLEPYMLFNFVLRDKDGYIVPILEGKSSDDITYIEKFALQITMDNYTNVDQLKAKYYSVRRDDEVYKVVYTIVTSNKLYMIGTIDEDILLIQKNVYYAFGGEEMDIYSISNQWPVEGVIDNQSEDKIIDILSITFNISDITVYRNLNTREGKRHNDLVLVNKAGKYLMVSDYFKGKEYQHLIVIDRNNGSYIPLYMIDADEYQFITFCCIHQSNETSFVITSDVKEFVLAAQKENVSFDREHFSLIVKVQNDKEDETELKVKIDDFYSSNLSMKIFLYNDGSVHENNCIDLDTLKDNYNNTTNLDVFFNRLETTYNNIINLNTSKIDDGSTDNADKIDSNSILDVREVPFLEDMDITFNHNIDKNGVLTPVSDDEQKLGILWISNIHPGKIAVTQKYNDLIFSAPDQTWVTPTYPNGSPIGIPSKSMYEENIYVTIRNYFVDTRYTLYILHLDFTDRDPIQIYTFNNTVDAIATKLSHAKNIYDIIRLLSSTLINVIDLRCVYSSYNLILKVNDMHEILGFQSLEDMAIFSSNCIFDESLLLKFKKNTAVFKLYNQMLSSKVSLYNYNTTDAADLNKVLEDDFLPTNIINFMEHFITHTKYNSMSRPYSEVRYKRSIHFNNGDISEYDTQHDLNSTVQDSLVQMSSSASTPKSWFTGISRKIANFLKSVTTTVGKQFSSSDRLDLDAMINIKSINQAPLNDHTLIIGNNVGNNTDVMPRLDSTCVNNILYLAMFFCTRKPFFKNAYISPQKKFEIQRNIVLEEAFENFDQAMHCWGDNIEDCV